MILFTMLQADAHNVYKEGTPLHEIICDGWARGFRPEQTLREASNAGFANCIVEPELKTAWARMDAGLAEAEAQCTARPSFKHQGHTWQDAYTLAVKQDEIAMREMFKTMTPEEINRFCFENGFVVPTKRS